MPEYSTNCRCVSKDNISELVKDGLINLSNTRTGRHLKTGDIRSLSAELFRSVGDKSKDNVFGICGELLECRSWAWGVIAFDFAYRVRKQYTEDDFDIFNGWLVKYVRGWDDCDDFCTHAFGTLLMRYPELFERVIPWTEHEQFPVRRAAAVILIPSIGRNKYESIKPFMISDLLLTDEHDLVRKGYGWMLKILAVREPQAVFDYLVKNKDIMPRVAFRYAIEKMDADMKRELMGLRKERQV